MTGLLILFSNSFKRVRTLVLSIGVLLAGFQVVLILVAGSIQRSEAFEQIGGLIPPFIRQLLGPAIAGLMSFGGVVALGYFHLSVMGSLIGVAISLATMPASEVETGFMDLILSRPIARHWIITRSIVLTVVCTLFLLMAMIAGTWTGLKWLAPDGAEWPKAELILSLAGNLGILMLSWSGVAMAIGSVSRRRSVAGATAGFLALATFFLDYVGRAWQPAESAAWFSPFRYYSPFDLLIGRPLPARDLIVLGCVALAGFVLAYVLFSRRDISH